MNAQQRITDPLMEIEQELSVQFNVKSKLNPEEMELTSEQTMAKQTEGKSRYGLWIGGTVILMALISTFFALIVTLSLTGTVLVSQCNSPLPSSKGQGHNFMIAIQQLPLRQLPLYGNSKLCILEETL